MPFLTKLQTIIKQSITVGTTLTFLYLTLNFWFKFYMFIALFKIQKQKEYKHLTKSDWGK